MKRRKVSKYYAMICDKGGIEKSELSLSTPNVDLQKEKDQSQRSYV